jgi:F-type H+-transporting ATPase subunit a
VGIIISTIVYAALTLLSTVLISVISGTGWLMGLVIMTAGVLLGVLWAKKTGKVLHWIVAGVTFVLGFFGLLESLGILSGVPIFTYGIPAVLSVYFDFFSGFIQALVFTLLSMVYIGNSQPAPESADAE